MKNNNQTNIKIEGGQTRVKVFNCHNLQQFENEFNLWIATLAGAQQTVFNVLALDNPNAFSFAVFYTYYGEIN